YPVWPLVMVHSSEQRPKKDRPRQAQPVRQVRLRRSMCPALLSRGMLSGYRSSVNNAVLTKVELGELTIGVIQLKLDWTLGRRPAPANLCLVEFKAANRLDADAVLVAGHRIEDRLAALINITRDLKPSASFIDVHLKLDLGEHWVVCLRKHRGIHLE